MLSRKEIEDTIYDILKKSPYGVDETVARECADELWDKGLVSQIQSTIYQNNTFLEMPPPQIKGYVPTYLTHKSCPSTKT